jgi:hypothetical protein
MIFKVLEELFAIIFNYTVFIYFYEITYQLAMHFFNEPSSNSHLCDWLIFSSVTDATLTLNPDYKWTGGPGRSSGITTFSW